MSTEKRPLKVFLSYASQDRPVVREIYDALKLEGWIDPWLDKAKILPGQDWQMVIETAVDEADVAILCFSNQSVSKEGFVQREIRYVYDIALEKPDGTIFLIPLRLEECEIPRKLRFLHRVDYFGVDKATAYADLVGALKLRYDQKFGIENNYRTRRSDGRSSSIPESDPRSSEIPGRQESNRPEEVRRRMDPTILAALIGGVITIIAAFIPLFASQFSTRPTATPTTMGTVASTPTDIAIITDTAIPDTPTFTPVPVTDTPIPSAVANTTKIPPVPIGKDWTDGCISTLWRPYPAEISVTDRGDGCWQQPVHVFFAEHGDLDVLAEGNNEEIQIYGLFAPLPESGRVNVTVRLKQLTNVDVWLGIFSEQDVTSQGLLITIPNGPTVQERVIVQKNPLNGVTITGTDLLEQGTGFSLTFTFDANSARSTVNPSVFFTKSVSIPSSQKWLFLGYKSLIGYYRIEGRFLEFELE